MCGVCVCHVSQISLLFADNEVTVINYLLHVMITYRIESPFALFAQIFVSVALKAYLFIFQKRIYISHLTYQTVHLFYHFHPKRKNLVLASFPLYGTPFSFCYTVIKRA